MDKTTLRNNLFDKYFEIPERDSILAADLLDKLSFIPELWKKLHVLCENYIEYFDSFCTLEKFKVIGHKQKRYLILKFETFQYVIIDLDKMENITEEQFKTEFDENFFINNFDGIKDQNNRNLFSLYRINNYNGNTRELVDFYTENQILFNLPTKLYYGFEIGEARTGFHIDFTGATAQMCFETPDQCLYEQLFLNYNLTAYRIQDAQSRIGIERMQEMFERIKKIRIPKQVIPKALYHQFLKQSNIKNYKKEKKI